MAEAFTAARIEQLIRTYIQACNDADPKAIGACFCPDALHYGPGASKWSGAAAIGDNFAKRVQEQGHCWTVDQVLVDIGRCGQLSNGPGLTAMPGSFAEQIGSSLNLGPSEFAKSDCTSLSGPILMQHGRSCGISTMRGEGIRRARRLVSRADKRKVLLLCVAIDAI